MDKIAELREKANKLPLLPGVYIMRDDAGEVIYVGKAKALKNRVTSYFRGEHLPKVAAMVSHVEDFSVILASSEFEALILENSLIKRYQPHYNILLRDDKTYPFLRLDIREEYPAFSLVNTIKDDGARYFGPYGGRGTAKSIVDTISKALKLPNCTRKLPRDIGKDRPCLNEQLGLCAGWCSGTPDAEEYRKTVTQAARILEGDTKGLLAELKEQMYAASDRLEFELAAKLRDRITAVNDVSNRQTVIKAVHADTDAVGFYRGAKTAFVVLHYTDGDLAGKEFELMPEPLEDDAAAVSALLRQYYARRGAWPKTVLLPMEIEDAEPLERLLSESAGRRVELLVPRRGHKTELVEAAARNAREESIRAASLAERRSKTLEWLQKALGLSNFPARIEAFDISNTGDFGIVASMTVFTDGKPLKKGYRKFRMKEVVTQDDFASMREAVARRMRRYAEGDEKFAPLPDLLLVDGGAGQVSAALAAMRDQGIELPVFGMVKDGRHRTRALATAEGEEIGIQSNPAVFALVGNIQEETHRFAVEYHRSLREGTIASELDGLPGIGPKRKNELLKKFKSVKAVKEAGEDAIAAVVPRNTAHAVYEHFHAQDGAQKGEPTI
jgi:excinuclease ABC subunit C